MLEYMIFGAVVVGVGILGRWAAVRQQRQCRAWENKLQCPEQNYDHCEAGFCIVHCREANRCNGLCVHTWQRLLEAAKES